VAAAKPRNARGMFTRNSAGSKQRQPSIEVSWLCVLLVYGLLVLERCFAGNSAPKFGVWRVCCLFTAEPAV
jgi:hypothetical protein